MALRCHRGCRTEPTLEAALAAIDAENDDEAIFHLEVLIAAGFTSRTLNLETLRDDALERTEIRRHGRKRSGSTP